MIEYYGNNDYRDYLMHYGVKGMKWGKHLKKKIDNIVRPHTERYWTAVENNAKANLKGAYRTSSEHWKEGARNFKNYSEKQKDDWFDRDHEIDDARSDIRERIRGIEERKRDREYNSIGQRANRAKNAVTDYVSDAKQKRVSKKTIKRDQKKGFNKTIDERTNRPNEIRDQIYDAIKKTADSRGTVLPANYEKDFKRGYETGYASADRRMAKKRNRKRNK